jgi:hypothetical protein
MPIFCFKRIVIAATTILVLSPISINIACYLFLSLITIGYNLNNRPMNSRVIQTIENTNEFFIMMSGYAIIIFSDWIYDAKSADLEDTPDSPELRYNLGFVYMAFLGFAVAVNFVLIISEISRELRKKYRSKIYYKKWGTHYKHRIMARHQRMTEQLAVWEEE